MKSFTKLVSLLALASGLIGITSTPAVAGAKQDRGRSSRGREVGLGPDPGVGGKPATDFPPGASI